VVGARKERLSGWTAGAPGGAGLVRQSRAVPEIRRQVWQSAFISRDPLGLGTGM
jgi:hypothetical protein